jgi:hypothetical protein
MLETTPADLTKYFEIRLLDKPLKLSCRLHLRVDTPATMQKISNLSLVLGRENLSQVLIEWMEEAKEHMDYMLEKAAENNHAHVGKRARMMQGSCQLLGFDMLAGLCQRIENATKRLIPRYKMLMLEIENEINDLTLMMTMLVHFLCGVPASATSTTASPENASAAPSSASISKPPKLAPLSSPNCPNTVKAIAPANQWMTPC